MKQETEAHSIIVHRPQDGVMAMDIANTLNKELQERVATLISKTIREMGVWPMDTSSIHIRVSYDGRRFDVVSVICNKPLSRN